MNEQTNKQLEYEIENLMRYRDNCINFIGLFAGGSFGLLVSSFSYFKLFLSIMGFLLAGFLFKVMNIIDKDVENKIKELK